MLVLDDLTTMALFAEVVERRSFTSAARASGMAKATVSRRIAALEARLGVRLLRRTTRAVIPTEEGLRLHEHCQRLVGAAKEATEVLSDAADRPAGLLRVSAPVAFAQRWLTRECVRFLQAQPTVQLQLLPRSTPADLVAEEVDVAIRVGPIADSTLVVRRIATDSVVVVGSPRYLQAHPAPRSLEELATHNVLRFSWEALSPQWRFRGSRSRSSPDLRGNFVASDADTVRQAAAFGLGLAVLPSFVVSDDVRAGRLARVLADTRLRELPISIVYAQRRHLARRVRAFVDFLVARFATQAWRKQALLVPKA